MAASDALRKQIGVVETAIKDAGPNEALHAIVDALKEVARTLDTVQGNKITVNGKA
jgi:hypothetical protein